MIHKRKIIVFAAVCAIVCSFLYAAFYNRLTVTEYRIGTDKLDGPVRIAFLADLHSDVYGARQEGLIARITEQNPDLILMSGDIADDVIPLDGVTELLAGIANRFGCYYVTGNHEFWSGQAGAIKDIFREYGVHVLEGGHAAASVRGQLINICGVDDPYIGEAAFKRQLDGAFDDIDGKLYTILLSHRPERFEQESAYKCDLILAGHAHGGQMRVPFINGGLYAPDQGFFPKYTGGVYAVNATRMVVSRGLSRGSTRIPRVFNPPELIVIELYNKSFNKSNEKG